MSATDFEQNDDLEGLSSEELEEQAFGPDPTKKRPRRPRTRRGRRRESGPSTDLVPVPPPPVSGVVVTRYCFACGAGVDARAEICPHCGVRQPEAPVRASVGKSKGSATLLALLLGGVGAHRFYLGQWKSGAVMLVFCWTFLPVLAGLVDFVRYAFMSDAQFAELAARSAGRPSLRAPSHPRLPSGVVSGPRAVTPTVHAVEAPRAASPARGASDAEGADAGGSATA